MSILEKDKVDGIGISKDGNKIILMISDHLEWDDEYEHLTMLQDKINAYISFIESGQIEEIYPEVNIHQFIISIHFKYIITEKCLEFLSVVNKQLNEIGIYIEEKLPQADK